MDPTDLVKKILGLEPKIRIATLFDLNGTVMSTTHRDDVKIVVSYEESLKSLQQDAKSWKLRNEIADKIGKGKFVLAAYEKIERITIPLDDRHLVYVTTDPGADYQNIINEVKKLTL